MKDEQTIYHLESTRICNTHYIFYTITNKIKRM